jgi:hypothetical protein
MTKILLTTFFLLLSSFAIAEEPDEKTPEKNKTAVWLNAGMLSHHFNRNKNLHEDNHGFGAEVMIDDDNSVTAGYFKNSDSQPSNYAGWVWKPMTWGPARVGVVVAMLDGYPRMHDGGWFPAALPVVSFEYRSVGVNLLFIPPVGNKVYSAVVAQFKLRVW